MTRPVGPIRDFRKPGEFPALTAITTFVLWSASLSIGVLGFTLPYARPQAPPAAPPPLQAQRIHVELADHPFPSHELPSSSIAPLAVPPPPPEPMRVTEAAPMIAVAEPLPAVDFALPVEAPARIVEPAQATHRRPVETNRIQTAAAPAVQSLTYGQGEGRQPAPRYPRLAIREGQEGTVLIRLSVNENGRVMSATAVSPSPWPLLNDAALEAVRQRWRFSPGSLRYFEVPIRFELKR
ncbi:MAG TPA: energy transducer TonB [Methylomirabilota bacterium]|nr:energy transducer TonB [Methylomirabilota bacterium]